MGYTTDFSGNFTITPPLKPEHAAYLTAFSDTRRVTRDANKAALVADPIREAVGLPVGVSGCNFVGASGFKGQEADESIVSYNFPPGGQPSLWCDWTVGDFGEAIVWNGGEKFHDYIPWLEYLIENYLKPWGYTLNGDVFWQGEDHDDMGIIVVTDNAVTTKIGKIVYE